MPCAMRPFRSSDDIGPRRQFNATATCDVSVQSTVAVSHECVFLPGLRQSRVLVTRVFILPVKLNFRLLSEHEDAMVA